MTNQIAKKTDFSDERVFMVPHVHAAPGKPLDFIGYGQACDGPTYIHVGIGLTDEQLQRIWESRKRFPTISMEQLMAVRDCKVQALQVA